MFFNLPICDIDAIIGEQKHLNEQYDGDTHIENDRIAFWGYCTCLQAPGWPKEYAGIPGADWTPEECRKKGRGDDPFETPAGGMVAAAGLTAAVALGALGPDPS